MADRLASPLSQSWLDMQACLCPAGFLIYAGSLHDQRLDSKLLAKHSRFFGYKGFLKGLGALPGPDIFRLCPTCSPSVSDFYIFPKYFPASWGRPVSPGLAGSLGVFWQIRFTGRHVKCPPTTVCPSPVSWMLKGRGWSGAFCFVFK